MNASSRKAAIGTLYPIRHERVAIEGSEMLGLVIFRTDEPGRKTDVVELGE
jgi:hypothetical protein